MAVCYCWALRIVAKPAMVLENLPFAELQASMIKLYFLHYYFAVLIVVFMFAEIGLDCTYVVNFKHVESWNCGGPGL